MDRRRQTTTSPRWARLFVRLKMLWVGVAVGALFGAIAGLIEAAQVTGSTRSAGKFEEIFGYAVLIDATLFGLLAGLADLLARGIMQAVHRRLEPAREIAILATASCLMVGLLALWHWELAATTVGADSAPALAPSREVQLTLLGAAFGLAILVGAILTRGRRASARSLAFGYRLAPVMLGVLLALAAGYVLRDLGQRVLGFGVAARPPLGSSVSAPDPLPAPPVRSNASLPTRPPPSPGNFTASQPDPSPTAADGQTPRRQLRPSPTAVPSGPNVLLITIDTLRADHVGAAG